MLFDLHIHSKYSSLDSVTEIEDIIESAKRVGMGAIAISDHDVIEGSLKAAKLSSKELIIIPSMEISSLDGHIIGLGIRELVRRDLPAAETVERIHALGGLAIAAHPYDTLRRGVGDLSWKTGFDAIEVNGHCLYGNSRAEGEAKKHGKPVVGGSDAHSANEVGIICTRVDGKSANEILGNIRKGLCNPVYKRNLVSLKTSVLAGKLSRRIGKGLKGD